MTIWAKRGTQEDREDNGCFFDDQEVLVQTKVWAVIGDERANDQTNVKFSHGRWWMTYVFKVARGCPELGCAGMFEVVAL